MARPESMNAMTLLLRMIGSGLLLLSWPALLGGCKKEVQVEQQVRPVLAMRISDAPALIGRSFPGTAESVDAVELSFRVGGPLVAFPANELGKKVSKGDLLAQIDSRDFEVRLRDSQATLSKARSELEAMRKARPEEIEQLKAGVDRAKATADFARAEHKRNLSLTVSGAISASELEMSAAKTKLTEAELLQAQEALRIGQEGARPEDIKAKEAQIESLQAAVQSTQDELTDTKLVAPFDGTVSAVYVENYEVVQPKQRIVRLVNTSELEMRVDIPESLIALVPQVREATVTIQAFPDAQIPARIAEVGTEASPMTRTYPVKVRFSPPPGLDVRPGMTGFARGKANAADTNEPSRQVVPTTAVFDRDDKQLVWIYNPTTKTVQSRPISVLATTPYGLSVSGLKPDEWVVTAGVHYLEENQAVRLIAEDAQQAGSDS